MASRIHNVQPGDKCGKWTVLGEERISKRWIRSFLCRCDCGYEGRVDVPRLVPGKRQSRSCRPCGNRAQTHRNRGLPPEIHALLWIWKSIRNRCLSPGHADYPNYGGRGITVCDEWAGSIRAFAAAVGPRPSPQHSIDRIDNYRGYEPGNVRWATQEEQMKNQRRTLTITVNGETLHHSDWAKRLGLGKTAVWHRVTQRGWDPVVAATKPRYGR